MKKTIQSLLPRHFKIVDLAIKGLGASEIADRLDMSVGMVSIVINSPVFKHEFALRRAVYEEREDNKQGDEEDNVVHALKEGAIKAARKLVEHVDSEDDGISVKSCAEVLDRSGYAKKREEERTIVGPNIIISADDASRIVESIGLNNELSNRPQPAELVENESKY